MPPPPPARACVHASAALRRLTATARPTRARALVASELLHEAHRIALLYGLHPASPLVKGRARRAMTRYK